MISQINKKIAPKKAINGKVFRTLSPYIILTIFGITNHKKGISPAVITTVLNVRDTKNKPICITEL